MADDAPSITAGDCLFVYGTLRRGERMDLYAGRKNFAVSYIGKEKVNGELFHLGGYPGLKLVKGGDINYYIEDLPSVIGETFMVRDPSIGAVLDAYESYPYLYDRKQLCTVTGRMAWTYIYNHPVTSDQLIETGDWKNPRISGTHRIPVI